MKEELACFIRGKIIFNSLKKVFQSLVDIPYAVIKGDALSLQAYGKLGKRNYSDVDILVARKDIEYIEKLLIDEGFSCEGFNNKRENRIYYLSSSHQIRPYFKMVGDIRVEIDINFDIYWGEFEGTRKPVEELLKYSIMQSLYGYSIKILPPLQASVQIMLHHYKEINSIYHLINKQKISKSLFTDVYYLFKNSSFRPMDLYNICNEWNIVPYAYCVIYYTSKVFNDNTLDNYLKVLETQQGKYLLDFYGLNTKERKKWTISFKDRIEGNQLSDHIKKSLNESDIYKLKQEYKLFS